MRDRPLEHIERGRIRSGVYRSTSLQGCNGAFAVVSPRGAELVILASDGKDSDPMLRGWEHVSVSSKHRTPNWSEMCWVKDAFWDQEESVVQYHPPRSQYVNVHPHCLHMWRPIDVKIPLPPSILVGPQTGRAA